MTFLLGLTALLTLISPSAHAGTGPDLTVSDTRAGDTLDAVVTGAEPHATVYLVVGLGGLGPGLCPPPFQGDCFDIQGPYRILAQTTADAVGEASISLPIPTSAPSGPYYLQVAAHGSSWLLGNTELMNLSYFCPDDGLIDGSWFSNPNVYTSPITGAIACKDTDGSDWFSFTAPDGETVRISVAYDFRADGDLMVDLYGNTLQPILDDAATEQGREVVSYTNTSGADDTVAAKIYAWLDYDLDGVAYDLEASVPGSCPTASQPSANVGNLMCIPPGTFTQGCMVGRDDVGGSFCNADEDGIPTRDVALLSPVWMMESEVTQAQWSSLMGNNPSCFTPGSAACWTNPGSDLHPVESVTWWEAAAFANAVSTAEGLAACYTLTGCTGTPGQVMQCTDVTVNAPGNDPYRCEGYRLPTEAEWEYAARGGESFPYAGSNDPGSVSWYDGNNTQSPPTMFGTKAVCTKARNAFGLCDMSGNVEEWIWDRWDGDHYPIGTVTDPLGPTIGARRAVRGGAWASPSRDVRVANRDRLIIDARSTGIGIRLVRSVP